MPPNSIGCDNSFDGNTGGYGSYSDAMPPSSNHPGGINVGMADGHVQFIKNSVGLQAWWCSAPGPVEKSLAAISTEHLPRSLSA